MKYDSLQVGKTYYTVTRTKMGNTTISTVSIQPVVVISCDSVKETVVASWNGNEARTYGASAYGKWRMKKPVTIQSAFGSVRLATRAEIMAATAASV